MIADDGKKSSIFNETVENFPILFSFDNEVANCDDAIISLEIYQIEKIDQLIVTTMNVSNDDSSMHSFRTRSGSDGIAQSISVFDPVATAPGSDTALPT